MWWSFYTTSEVEQLTCSHLVVGLVLIDSETQLRALRQTHPTETTVAMLVPISLWFTWVFSHRSEVYNGKGFLLMGSPLCPSVCWLAFTNPSRRQPCFYTQQPASGSGSHVLCAYPSEKNFVPGQEQIDAIFITQLLYCMSKRVKSLPLDVQ